MSVANCLGASFLDTFPSLNLLNLDPFSAAPDHLRLKEAHTACLSCTLAPSSSSISGCHTSGPTLRGWPANRCYERLVLWRILAISIQVRSQAWKIHKQTGGDVWIKSTRYVPTPVVTAHKDEWKHQTLCHQLSPHVLVSAASHVLRVWVNKDLQIKPTEHSMMFLVMSFGGSLVWNHGNPEIVYRLSCVHYLSCLFKCAAFRESIYFYDISESARCETHSTCIIRL